MEFDESVSFGPLLRAVMTVQRVDDLFGALLDVSPDWIRSLGGTIVEVYFASLRGGEGVCFFRPKDHGLRFA